MIEKKLLKFEAEGREFEFFFEITWTIYSNSERSEQFFITACFFNLFLEISQIKKIRTIIIQIGKEYWDLEICRKSYNTIFISLFILTFNIKSVIKIIELQSAKKAWTSFFVANVRNQAQGWLCNSPRYTFCMKNDTLRIKMEKVLCCCFLFHDSQWIILPTFW